MCDCDHLLQFSNPSIKTSKFVISNSKTDKSIKKFKEKGKDFHNYLASRMIKKIILRTWGEDEQMTATDKGNNQQKSAC